MANLFKTPKVEKPKPVPTRDDALGAMQERQRLAQRKGRASTIIAGQTDTGTASGPGTKVLLGQ